MRFEGLVIKESLEDESVLEAVRITRVETWNASDPPIWTATFIEGDASQADSVAAKFSRALRSTGWYCNVTTERDSYVIFAGRVFKYPRGDERGRAEAQAYGRSLGLPEEQLEWGESFSLT